jgi:2-phospho-L-lactate/phosphoenolpyruvate guanylyltransferase
MSPDWSLLVPVKVLGEAKSRLAGLPAAGRAELALAMAADTVAAAVAATAVATVVVITDDPAVRGEAARIGALVLPDEPGAGLNEALSYGAIYARDHWPGNGVAGLTADLPALRSGELTRALRAAAERGRAFVPDAGGSGTTMYATAPGASFEPLFGAGSRDRHLAAGVEELDLPDLAGLRRDVDTADDLRLAEQIGVGPRTRALLDGGR